MDNFDITETYFWLMDTIETILESPRLMKTFVEDNILSFLEFVGITVSKEEVPLTLSERLTLMLLFAGSAFFFTYAATYYPRKVEHAIIKLNTYTDKKLCEIRRRYKALGVQEAILLSRNFGADENVPIGAFNSDVKIEELKKAISMIEKAIDNEIKFTAEMSEYIKPFLKEVTGDGVLPDGLDLVDTLGLLRLFARYLEEREPVRGREPREEDVINPIMLRENKILRQILNDTNNTQLSQSGTNDTNNNNNAAQPSQVGPSGLNVNNPEFSQPGPSGLNVNKASNVKKDTQPPKPGTSGLKLKKHTGPKPKQ